MKNTFKSIRISLFIIFLVSIIFIRLFTLENSLVAEASNGIDEELFNEQSVYLDKEFRDDCVIVVLKHRYSDSIYHIDFNEFVSEDNKNFGEANDLFYVEDLKSNELINKDKFSRILSVQLINKGRENVIRAIEVLQNVEMVFSVEPDYIYDTENEWIPSDKYYKTNQWGLNGTYGIDIEKAWDISQGQNNVRVGLFESGVQMNHEDLNGRVSNPNFSMGEMEHGTHVAGIIGAISNNNCGIAGIAQVDMIPLNRNSFVNSLAYATNNNIWIINASYYYVDDDKNPAPMVPSHLAAIQNYEGLLICSAGNNSNNTDRFPQYPAGYGDANKYNLENVISVGSINRNGQVSDFSNYGSTSVHIFAPGESIYSTLPNNKYGYMSGTSMAAPMVTGVAALMFSRYYDKGYEVGQNLTHAEVSAKIKEDLIATANYHSNLDNKCISNGYLNAYEALKTVFKFDTAILDDGTLQIIDIPYQYNQTEIIIPEEIKGRTVTSIGARAFIHQTNITSISVPATVTSIEDRAFEYAQNLEYCLFPEDSKLQVIGDSAFYKCKLTYFKLPRYVKEIKAFTFCDTKLERFEFSENSELEIIGESAFSNCDRLTKINIPSSVVEIKEFAFSNCTYLDLSFSADSNLQLIESLAFDNCITLAWLILPNSLINIGPGVFRGCTGLTIVQIPSDAKLKRIGGSAFEGSTNLTIFQLPASVSEIAINAFRNCSELISIVLSDNVNVDEDAFTGCNKLTIYFSESYDFSNWNFSANRSNRPMVLGCKLDSATRRVMSFERAKLNPLLADAENGISNPRYDLIDQFEGWYATADFKGAKYTNIADAPYGMLYAKWKDACVAEGSLITLADGTQKAVEDLTGDEQLLVWNMFTGTFDTAPILFIDSESRQEYEVINVSFSDGTTVKVISEHAFWDFDLNKYVFLRADAARYIGHWFNKQTVNADGEKEWSKVQLVDVELTREITAAYSPVTYGHLCYYVNGMLSMPGATEGLINIFDVDGDTMKIDEASFNKDIEKYGLFTYEEFAELLPISEEVFDAFGGQYLKVAIGKGLTDMDKLAELIARYAEFF